MALNTRSRKIIALLEQKFSDDDNEGSKGSSPLTTEQLRFIKVHRDLQVYKQCFHDIANSPSSHQEVNRADYPEKSPTGIVSDVNLFSSDSDDTDPVWVPPKRRRNNKNISGSPLILDNFDLPAESENSIPPSPDITDHLTIPRRRRLTIISSSSSDTLQPVDVNAGEVSTGVNEIEAVPEKKKSRKRTRNKSQWKKEVAKKRRLEGKEYVSAVTGKVVAEKKLKPPCPTSCKFKCQSKLSEDTRRLIFKEFWEKIQNTDQRRQFISGLVQVKPVSRPARRPDAEKRSRRQNSRTYTFVVENIRVHVCQKMFLRTLDITEQYVSTTLLKTSGLTSIVEPDKRGKHVPSNKTDPSIIQGVKDHINSFPRYTSHYSRSKTTREYLGPDLSVAKMHELYIEKCIESSLTPKMIAKEWLYRKIFNEDFNLAFYSPSADTCDTCDKFMSLLKHETNPEERQKITALRQAHLEDSQNRYSLKKKDKEDSKNSNGKAVTVMMDMQKCLPTPLMTNSQSFYLRKLWVLNETIHNDTTNKSYCMMWDETQGGRGANEVGSCVIEWALNYIDQNVEDITIWSDNCAGQNRNIVMIYCYFWLLQNTAFKTINHKFLLRGHTHCEVDVVHSVIERRKKQLTNFDIVVPRDWEQFVKICKTNNPLIVHNMNIRNIRNIKGISSIFSQRRKNTENEPFLISRCVWLQVRKQSPGILFYKTSFADRDFSQIDMRRNTRQEFELPPVLQLASKRLRPISTPKYKDLVTLTEWIPDPILKKYYLELPHGNVPDIEESDEEQ